MRKTVRTKRKRIKSLAADIHPQRKLTGRKVAELRNPGQGNRPVPGNLHELMLAGRPFGSRGLVFTVG